MTDEEFKNLKIGEIFCLGNKKLKVEESKKGYDQCEECFFGMVDCYEFLDVGVIPKCKNREDGKYVYFKEVEENDQKGV